MGGQKFAVLLCADDSDYVKKLHGGYYGVFVRMLKEEGEKWDVYKVANGDFPADDEIGEYDGFVITGSCNDAHGNDLWICKLLMLLKKLDAMKKKVLGICFGHQVCLLISSLFFFFYFFFFFFSALFWICFVQYGCYFLFACFGYAVSISPCRLCAQLSFISGFYNCKVWCGGCLFLLSKRDTYICAHKTHTHICI